MEPERSSGVHLFNAAFKLFLALFLLRSDAHYECSLHDQVQSTAAGNISREETVEFP
jgi:hypothetical protein